ncbi:MAG: hypothetical protein Q9227_007703 [Pyrenula ochraceoflavens]
MADKYGRRLIVTICLVGEYATAMWHTIKVFNYDRFGSRALLTSAIFRLVGGGSTVISAILMAMIADSLPDELRSQAFFYLMASVLVGELAGTPIGSLLMTVTSIKVPLILGMVICWLAIPILWLVPEKKKNARLDFDGAVGVADTEQDQARSTSILRRYWLSAFSECRKIGLLLFRNKNVVLGMLAVLTSKPTPQLLSLLPQYASKRYNWTIAKASLLVPFRDVAQLILLGIVLPLLTRYQLKSLHLSAPRSDRKIAKYSALWLTIGTFLCGVAAHPVMIFIGLFFFTLGMGFRASLQSFLSASVPKASLATLFVGIGVIDTLGHLLIAPALAFTLAKGIGGGIGGPGNPGGGAGSLPGQPDDDEEPNHVSKWVGLPYVISSVAFLVTTFCTMGLSVEKAEAHAESNRLGRQDDADDD